ncbi:MAG: hypothetical protein IJB32_04840 [Clostridia bacterium]|nr:hypothetical protein [Clostridia bacterium]
MAGNILTPVTLWGGFKTDKIPECTVIDEKKDGEIIFKRCYIEGRKVNEERVRIFATIASSSKAEKMPCVLLLQDFLEEQDQKLIKNLIENGYMVVSLDLSGKVDGKENYTEYPKEIEYANFEIAKETLYTVKGDASETCWYEWGCVVRYALEYLKNQKEITNIGGLGIGEAATVLWQVSAMDDSISSVAFVLNAGWMGYRGIHKFGGQVEPQFSDNMYKFIAGIEPQAYAMHIKCPVLMLSATNSDKYDCDRAYDTLSRIEKDVYKAINYSIGYIDRVSGEAYNNLLIFYDKFLKNPAKKKNLPQESDIKVDFIDGKMAVTVEPDVDDLKEITLYASEETTAPSERCWIKVSERATKTESGYLFEYHPYHASGLVTFFAKVQYKSGFVVGTNIVTKKFKAEETFAGYKSNILYSSRIKGCESIFFAENQIIDNPFHLNIKEENPIKVMKGPMDIEGVYCKWGLVTFKINAVKDKPKQDAMFMFDVYSENDNEITVKLISDYYGAKTEYVAKINVRGGGVWHNVKLEKAKFKTAEGMSLKSYDKVNAVAFNANGKWLVNNALWV